MDKKLAIATLFWVIAAVLFWWDGYFDSAATVRGFYAGIAFVIGVKFLIGSYRDGFFK